MLLMRQAEKAKQIAKENLGIANFDEDVKSLSQEDNNEEKQKQAQLRKSQRKLHL
jgi:hypothetical protein